MYITSRYKSWLFESFPTPTISKPWFYVDNVECEILTITYNNMRGREAPFHMVVFHINYTTTNIDIIKSQFWIVSVGENSNNYDLYGLVIHDCAIKLSLFEIFTM